MKRLVFVALALLAVLVAASVAGAGGGNSDAAPARGTVDTSIAAVQLKSDPLTVAPSTRPAPGKKIDFNSNTVKSYRAKLAAERNEFKQWLRANAPAAKVVREFDTALNAVTVELNGTSLETLKASPLVRHAEYSGVYTQADANDPDLVLIDALQAWANVGGPANAGKGINVGILDTGIDITHPCFSDAGYGAITQLGDRRFTNNKVFVARVFNMQARNRGYTPDDFQDHGSHVAGTVGCKLDTPAEVQGVTIPYGVSGVAPSVRLGNYNVFPGSVESVRWEDLLDALETAYADGMDVVNMSIGGRQPGIQSLVEIAINNLDEAGMVSAVANGNSGPGFFTAEAPGSAARALTAGASTVGHFVGAPVTLEDSTVVRAASGDFATVTKDETADLGVVMSGTALGLACTALPVDSLKGKIAVISRGSCTFSEKIRNAQNAGAIGALIVNNVAGDPTAMGLGGIANEPTIWGYMVSRDYRQTLIDANGDEATVAKEMAYFSTANSNIMAGFSSQGPTDTSFLVKPDVVAPGVNVLSATSSKSEHACATPPCWAFFQGTSMATPHLAGSAAVVKAARAWWTAADIRSAIVNTAKTGVLKNFSTGTTDTQALVTGSGLADLDAALDAAVSLDPVSISFGATPSGSGQTRSATLTLKNLTGGSKSYGLAVTDTSSVDYGLSASSVTLPAGESKTVTVSMTSVKGAAFGPHAGTLTVTSGGSSSHAVVFTFVK